MTFIKKTDFYQNILKMTELKQLKIIASENLYEITIILVKTTVNLNINHLGQNFENISFLIL